MRRILLLTTALCWLMLAMAQRPSLRVVSQTPVEGAEEVLCLMFDHNGLMWIGTDQGVRTYDGYNFRAYRNDAYSPGILPNNYVYKIAEAPDDRMWLGTHNGLACFNHRSDTFKTYHLRGQNARYIDALFTSSDGTVWAGTPSGVSRYDAENDDFIDIPMPVGVRSFSEDSRGNIYIGTWEGGLYRLDRQSSKLIPYPRLSERNTVQSQLMDSRGRLWIGTWENGIVRLDHPENEADPGIHRINEGRRDFRTFHQLVEDSVSHAVWGCCIEGLTSVDLDDVSQVENHPQLSFCYDLETDGHGNLWGLTRNQGIVHLSTNPSPFRYYHLDPSGLELPVNRIQTVFTTNGQRFWIGLQPYGLACYDLGQNTIAYNNRIPGFSQMTGTTGIHAQNISAIIERSPGELWMASSRGIIVWREGEPARLLLDGGVPYLAYGEVNAFCRLHDGSILIGESLGLGISFSESEGRLLVSNIDVRHITEAHDHRVWIATDNSGIMCASGDFRQPQTVSYRQYSPAEGNYPLQDATAVYEDSHHRLWAISNSGALFLYEPENDRFIVVNHRFHLYVNRIYAINGDKQGRLWLSTDQGLVSLKIDDQGNCHPACYSEEDGIAGFRFSANGLSRYGKELYLGNAAGFFSFDPGQIDRWHPASSASLLVTSLLLNDRPYEWLDSADRRRISADPPFATRQITIPASIEKFTIEFALLALQNVSQCHYAYRLDGYDSDWHHTNADDRRATYQNLPAGHYQLRLRAIDSYGRPVQLPYDISIRVLPPWYRTWWAYLLYLLAIAAAVYGISEWYKARLKRKARLQQRVNELLHYRELMLMQQFNDQKALEAEEQQHNTPDELFIQRAIDCVKNHLMDGEYDREQFARDMLVSSSTLYNKLRALTGQNVTGFINSIRLKEACRIARQQPDINVNELSMAVGFNTPKYFTRCFKKEFGELPSEYIERISKERQ